MAFRSSARPRGRAVALALAGLLVVAGCTGGGDPDESVTTTATPSVTSATESPSTASPEPTETSALPPLPDAARENSPEGAEAFIRYWFDVVNIGYTTPMAGVVKRLSHAECIACQGIEDQIENLVAEEQRVTTGPFELRELVAVGGGAPGVTSFNVQMHQPANEFLSATGEVIRESAALDKTGVVAAIWEEEGWLLYDSALE